MEVPAREDTEAGGPPEEEQALLASQADTCGSDCMSPPEGAECRICCSGAQPLHSLCGCRGSIQWVHDACAQRWCDEKGNTTCELCQQPLAGVAATHVWRQHPAPVTAALLALSLRYARAAEQADSGRRRVSGWVVAALSTAGLLLLFQAVAVSQEADQRNRAFYVSLLRAALILAPLLFFLHMVASIRRRRAADEQALLAGQMAASIAAAVGGGNSRGRGDPRDSMDGIPLALLAHAMEHNLSNARPLIDDSVLHATLHEAEAVRERNEAAILAAVDAAVLHATRGAAQASPGGQHQQGEDAA